MSLSNLPPKPGSPVKLVGPKALAAHETALPVFRRHMASEAARPARVQKPPRTSEEAARTPPRQSKSPQDDYDDDESSDDSGGSSDSAPRSIVSGVGGDKDSDVESVKGNEIAAARSMKEAEREDRLALPNRVLVDQCHSMPGRSPAALAAARQGPSLDSLRPMRPEERVGALPGLRADDSVLSRQRLALAGVGATAAPNAWGSVTNVGSQLAGAAGAEWIARLQGADAVTAQQESSLTEILQTFGRAMKEQGHHFRESERSVLAHHVGLSLDALKQTIVRSAFSMVCAHVEELRSLRMERKQLTENITKMNRNFMEELARKTTSPPPMSEEATKAFQKVKKEVSAPCYDPLAHLPEELRSTVLAVIEEKLKALFAFTPEMRAQINPMQLAKLEDSFAKERLQMLEKQQVQLKKQNTDLKQKVEQLEVAEEALKHQLEAVRARQGAGSPSSLHNASRLGSSAEEVEERGLEVRPPSASKPTQRNPKSRHMASASEEHLERMSPANVGSSR